MANPFSRPLTNRAVHLRITPRPSNLGESREMMRLLSQFGEIEYFKSLKYDALSAPNAALVIYKEESAAKECMKRSPIRFRMGRVERREVKEEEGEMEDTMSRTSRSMGDGGSHRGPLGTPFGLGSSSQIRSLSTTSLPTPPPLPTTPFAPDSASSSPTRLFQIQTNTSHRRFRDIINAGHYHGSFAIDSKMPGQEDLAKKVPWLGLSCVDWRAGDRPWRAMEKERAKLGGRGSLGSLVGWKKGEEVGGRDEVVRKEVEEVDVGVGVGVDLDELELERKGGDFKPSGVKKNGWGGNERYEDEGGALGDFMKGLERVVSDFSPGDAPVERYSRKRR